MNSICFYAPHVVSAFSPKLEETPIGGAEVQQSILIKELVERGFPVVVITRPFEGDIFPDGVTIVKGYNPKSGIKGLRIVLHTYALLRALFSAKADVYYIQGARYETFTVAIFSWLFRKKFIQHVASDMDCSKNALYFLSGRIKKKMYVMGIKFATIIFAQTSSQMKMIQDNFGRKSYLVKNIWNPNLGCKFSCDVKTVLWVGSFKSIKRPDIFINLSRSFPDIKFIMIGSRVESEGFLYEKCLSEISSLPNVEHIPFVSLSDIEEYYRATDMLVCTSLVEGFPNTILQSWRNGRPVLSSFDPDNLIKDKNLGWFVENDDFVSYLKAVLSSDSEFYKEKAINSLEYIKSNHSSDVVMEKFVNLVNSHV